MARKEFFHRRDHTNGVLFATRGCPNHCDFCTVAVMYRHTLRKRPVAEVAAEYASFKGKVIIFWDDNIAADLEYAQELFHAIAPYRSGGAARPASMPGRTRPSWKRPPAVAASNCSWGWSRSPNPACPK